MKKVVIAGGSGFLGKTLAKWFQSREVEVVVLTRQRLPIEGARVVHWDGIHLGDWARELEEIDGLVNLAGRSVNCRYHEKNRREIMDSRVLSTRILGEAVQDCTSPPCVWLNSSTATIYQHTYGPAHDEKKGVIGSHPEAKDAFSIEVAKAWEKTFAEAVTSNTRKAVLRTAIVYGLEPGGVYEMLRLLVKMGLGGKMGHGKQFVSWIHAIDFCRIVEWLLTNENATGIYNVCAPNPLPNAEMMKILRRVLGVPIGLPATRWMLEIGAWLLRTETELILKSRRVIPARLLEEGFVFQFPDFEKAIQDLAKGDS